jgi:hypothetical protein
VLPILVQPCPESTDSGVLVPHPRVAPARAHPGLTSRQAWTLRHTTRCPCCGAWEVVDRFELRARQLPTYVVPAWCRHLAYESLSGDVA